MWCATSEKRNLTAIRWVVGLAVCLLAAPMVYAQADLAVTAVADPNPAIDSTDTTYTITVVNNGPGVDPTVTLDIIFPDWGMPFPGDEEGYEDVGYSGQYGGTFADGECGWIRWVDEDSNFINPGMQCTFILENGAYADVEINTPLVPGPPPYAVSGVTIDSPAAIAGDYDSLPADGWGREWDGTWTISEQLVFAGVQGAPPLPASEPREACDDNVTSDVDGKIALIDRGNCDFSTKALNVQLAGASAALVMNNVPGQSIFGMGAGTDAPFVSIPAAMLSYEDGQVIRQYVEGGIDATVQSFFPTDEWKLQSTFYTRDPTNDPDCPGGDCDAGSNNTFFHTLTVLIPTGEAPDASFTYEPMEPVAGQDVTFTDTSTGTPTSWMWDFGDGETSTDQSPVHAFADAGTYTVTLTASNASGDDTFSADVTVAAAGEAPTASFSYDPMEPVEGGAVTFTDTSTGAPTSWMWDFGDGETSTDQNPMHTFAMAGTYTVSLTATNDFGDDTASAEITVATSGGAPVASFTYMPETPVVGQEIAFTDTSSGMPESWEWAFGDGETSTEQNPMHIYTAPGTYIVTLTATNAMGSDQATAQLTVRPETPDLEYFYFVPAAALAEGAEGAFFVTDLDVNNAGDADIMYQFLWLPRDMDNSEPLASDVFTLGAGMSVRYTDVLSSVFSAEPDVVGALAIMADDMSNLLLMSRTYNDTDAGTFGQSIPGMPMDAMIPANTRMRVLFGAQNDSYRTNLGLLNGTGMPITVAVELFGADGTSLDMMEVELPAWGNTQLNRVFLAFEPVDVGYIDVWTTTEGGYFAAYGSVLDMMTSDPTTVLPQ